MREFFIKDKDILTEILKYFLLILTGLLVLLLFVNNQLSFVDYEKILSTLLSTSGITVAIIVSFLFTKLFSERNERIERKKLIDVKAKQITAFRKICHFIRSSHKFWQPFGNLKAKFDNEYKTLTLSSYDSEEINYKKYAEFLNEVNFGEIGGQAYTGFREIEGQGQSDIVFYDNQLRKNYSLAEIALIHDASSRIWNFLDKYKVLLIDIKTIDSGKLKQIEKNIKIIYSEYDVNNLNKEKITEMFNEFHEDVSRNLYNLTQKNSKHFGKSISNLLFDLLAFVLIMVLGIFILSFDYSLARKIFDIQCLISAFIVFVFDLLLNVVKSIRQELIIDEFYEP